MEGDLNNLIRIGPAVISGNEHICMKRNCFYCDNKQRPQTGSARKLMHILDMKNTFWKEEEITHVITLKSNV